MGLTLGGYNSFIRNFTKNILHDYRTYDEHWILGYVYRQKPCFPEYDLDNLPRRGDIECPYSNVECFVRRKHEIAGLRAGSGNTKNIGSVKVRAAADFRTVLGPFMGFDLSKEACDHYWRKYETYCKVISTPAQLVAHLDFAQFRVRR
jgi:hypothetical protein